MRIIIEGCGDCSDDIHEDTEGEEGSSHIAQIFFSSGGTSLLVTPT